MGFLSFMILIWEHVITFADEVGFALLRASQSTNHLPVQVEYIWFGKKGLGTFDPVPWRCRRLC